MSSVVLDILLRDHGAQKGMVNLGKATEVTATKMTKLKVASLITAGTAGAAILKFGKDSVKAYSDAEDSQKALGFAFQKFPALADTNQAALQKLNTALQKKTQFDDDTIASGQAVLAQFKLTGKQLTEVTPLLLDYASKTGKDIPTAAKDVGKALLGNAKALKNIGIAYKSTGDSSKDFTNITALMRQKVGGFAELEGKTFSGRMAILKNQFGELQETAGSKLVPALSSVVGELTGLVEWVGKNSDVIVPLVTGMVGLTGAVWLASKASKAWAATQGLTAGLATKAVGGLNLLKIAFTGVALTAEGAGRAMKIAQLAIPGVGIALFAVTTAMQIFASKSDDSTGSAADFSSAMQSIEGSVTRATAALNENVRTQAVNALQSKGAYEQAHLLGIAYGTVTDAALGNKDAIAEVNRVIGAAVGPSKDLSAAHVAARNAANGLAGTMGEVARQSIKDTAAEQTRRGALVGSVAPTVTLTAMTNDLKTAQKNLRTEIQKVIDKFTILKDGALSQDAANSAWQASLDGVSDSVKTNGTSLSSHTTKGRANREAVRNMITALNDKITSDVKASGSTKGLTEKMKDGEAKIRAAAKAAGYNKTEVDAMIRKMLKTPKQVQTDIKTPGMIAAQKNVDSLGTKIRNLNGRTVTVRADFAGGGKVTATTGGHTQTVHFRAAGGVLPGYTPGRDVHMFHSATGGTLGLSGGEAVMRPEWTQAVGVGGVNKMNAAARSGGAPAVRQMMGFADGGVYRSINVNTGTHGSANIDSNYAAAIRFGGAAERKLAVSAGRLAAALAAIAAANDTSGPIAGGGYAAALRFARSQAGKPYIWAGVGPRGYDCSGFMSALDNVVHGRNPYHRLFSTSFFHGQANGPGGFHHNKRSAFMVGVTHAGVGHMAGTLNGVNVESSGGRGVHLGSGARGWHNGLFRMHYGLAGGGVIGDPPFDLLDPRGQYYDPSLLRALYGTPILHDGGGRIPPGDTLVRNKTRQPERVLTGAQNRAFEKLTRVGGGGGGGITININATFPNYVGNRSELKRTLQDMGRNGDMRAILASAGRG